MELDRDNRSHFHTTNSSSSPTATDLFICSSSMRLTSKSIFSPARPTRGSLSSSLSRRNNGSLKGGTSPFFTTKKRDQENQEPSSPKVTCIGQVRVLKTKKKKKKKVTVMRQSRNLSIRESQNQNQRWAHLPISICEALKAIGAEFSCLFPCKNPCFMSSSGKCEGRENGCGKGFTRWLVSVNDDDNESGKRREIEVVVGGDGDEEGEEMSSRRHVFEDLEVKDFEKGRVSVCVPPKNALLLMRCRSDPMKVAALTSRFTWDATSKIQDLDNDEDAKMRSFPNLDGIVVDVDGFEVKDEIFSKFDEKVGVFVESSEEVNEISVEEKDGNCEEEEVVVGKGEEMVECESKSEENNEEEMFVGEEEELEEEVESNMSSFEALLENQESSDQNYEDCPIQENDTNKIGELSESQEEDNNENREFDDDVNQLKTEPEEKEETNQECEEIELLDNKNEEESQQQQVLPDCLLLMMREPKLSMEVSKETWVCTNDFIRWLPQRPPKKSHCHHAPVKRALSMESKPKKIVTDQSEAQLVQPPRWSCSLPPKATSMATMIEQKLVNAAAYEPLVLTRCKSEPMRTASAKVMLEPHRRATVGTAGVGF